MRIEFFIGELLVNYSKEIPMEIKFLLPLAEIRPFRTQDLVTQSLNINGKKFAPQFAARLC